MWIFDNFFGNQRKTKPASNLTCHQVIIQAMQRHSNKLWDARDFQHGSFFVGYKAGTRISELRQKGLLENGEKDGRFQTYRLTDIGKKIDVRKV